jgi:hypothetical protein
MPVFRGNGDSACGAAAPLATLPPVVGMVNVVGLVLVLGVGAVLAVLLVVKLSRTR